MCTNSSKNPQILQSVEYGHYILNDTYNSIISDEPVRQPLHKVKSMYNDICSFDSEFWKQPDNVPADLARVCPKVLEYIKEQNDLVKSIKEVN